LCGFVIRNLMKKKKVLVAMSGGVDSSTAAFLLQKKGYEVMGVFMRLDDKHGLAEAAARQVCDHLGIKFYPVNLSAKFKKEIINYFVDSYKKGLTPNPCVKCNQLIKFGELLRIASELDCEYLATGHYTRLRREFPISLPRRQAGNFPASPAGGQFPIKMLRAKDDSKDQTYFLYNLTQKQLKKILFPLGEYKKEDIKKIAKKEKLPVLKSESQDVCFLNIDGKIIEHNDYLKKYIKKNPGPIKTIDGKIIGKHQGLPFYTIGQRRGVEIGGTGPYYVVRTDYITNTLYVSTNHDDPELYKKELIAKDVNWLAGIQSKMPLKCEAVIRYRHKAVKCKISSKNGKYLVKFDKPQRAVAPGQSVVFYRGEELLGGGIIS